MKRFLIYCCVGSGGMFLTSVLAQMLNYDVDPVLSSRGHCHQLSKNGIWTNTKDINFIGEFWSNFRPDRRLFYTHVLDIDRFRQDHPDVKLILINFAVEDAELIARLFVCKAWPDIWSLEEYNKWAGPSWPAYSQNNIQESDLIRNEIIADLTQTRIKSWLTQVNASDFDYVIDFKTILGLNSIALGSQLENIVDRSVTSAVTEYIKQYQQINRELYINE
jgi:hypothetical protein